MFNNCPPQTDWSAEGQARRVTLASETSSRDAEWVRWHANSHGVDLLEAEFRTHVYERHIHEAYALGVTLKGVQRFWCRGTTRDSTAGNVIFINPGDAHDGQSGTDGSYAYRILYIPTSLVGSVLKDATEHEGREIGVATPVLEDPFLADQLNSLWAALAYASHSLVGDELLTTILIRIGEAHGSFKLLRDTRLDTRALHRVREYLRAHVEDNVGVVELAQIAEMSRFRLTRQFQTAFGLPLHAYHLHLKLDEAKQRLRLGFPIVRVATDLGFSDQSHLQRRFKGAFGMTPNAWRRANIAVPRPISTAQ